MRKLALSPLGDGDVTRLLRRLAGIGTEPGKYPKGPGANQEQQAGAERLGEWLATETGGQPFYLVQTLRTLLEEGELALRNGPGREPASLEIDPASWAKGSFGSTSDYLLPQGIREVVRSRISGLSPAASELLAAGAVLGRNFGSEELMGVASLGETEGLRGLDELLSRLLLEEDNAREDGFVRYHDVAYSFSHEKIRQVAYTESGQARRRALHRRAFEMLEAGDVPHAELARHAFAGGLAGPSFEYSVSAGDDAAEVFAVRDALAHYERAREVLAARQRSGAWSEWSIPDLEHLYTQMARSYELANEWDKARTTYETMLAFAREAGEARLEVVSLNHLAVFHFHHERDLRKVMAHLEEARSVSEEAGLAESLVETQCNLADVAHLWSGDTEGSRPLAESALAGAQTLKRQDLTARALAALSGLEMFTDRLDVASAHAEEGVERSRGLIECPTPPRAEFPPMMVAAMGIAASWKAGIEAVKIQCLTRLTIIRIFQGRPQEGVAIAREAQAASEKLPERAETTSLWALGMALQEIGEYEEALALARRGTERAREVQDTYLLSANLGRLGEAYEVLLSLDEARAAYEEALKLGPYGPISHVRFCVLDALSEDWEDAYAHAKRAHEIGVFLHPLFSIYLHRGVEALVRGGDEGHAREEVRRFAELAQMNERDRISYLRSLAVLNEYEGDVEGAVDQLHKAEAHAEKIGLPGELWQIRAKTGEIYERRGEANEAQVVFSRAAQTLKDLASRIEDEELRKAFLSAPQARRVLVRDW